MVHASSADTPKANETWWNNYGRQLVAGALAGMVSDLVTHPIDTVRARQQVSRGINLRFFDVAKRTVHKYGLGGLYRGIGATMALTVPIHGIYYAGNEETRITLTPHARSENQKMAVDALGGLVAELLSSVFGIPYEVIKQRAQVQKLRSGLVPPIDPLAVKPSGPFSTAPATKHPASSLNIAKTIFREEGLKGFYRGTLASLTVWCPFASLYFMFYEQMKVGTSSFLGQRPEDLHAFWFLGAGAAAGFVSAFVTNPLDIVRTRLQTQGVSEVHHAADSSYTGRYAGMRDCFVKIYQHEGPLAFMKGLVARSLWISIYTSIGIVSYEHFRRILYVPSKDDHRT